MIFKLLSFLIVIVSLSLQANSSLPPAPAINATSYLLVDYDTGKVLLEKDINLPRDPASITKVMTAYVLLKELEHNPGLLSEKATISRKAYKSGGSRMFLEYKDKVLLKTLLLGIIIQSGNDAAIAIAEHIDGSEEDFAIRMNTYAQRLGMDTSNFVNATGWPHSEHYSSAEDLVKLATAFIKEFPEYYELFAKKELTYNNIKQLNRNRLLWRDPTVDGIKTGHTEKAGYCLLASARRGNRRLISVLLGAETDKKRMLHSQKLLNYGFRYFNNILIQEAGKSVLNERVWFGEAKELKIGFNEDWIISIPRRISTDLQAQYQLSASRLEAPIMQGQMVGTGKVVYKGEVLDTRPVYALESIERSGFFSRLLDHISYFFSSLLSWFSLE